MEYQKDRGVDYESRVTLGDHGEKPEPRGKRGCLEGEEVTQGGYGVTGNGQAEDATTQPDGGPGRPGRLEVTEVQEDQPVEARPRPGPVRPAPETEDDDPGRVRPAGRPEGREETETGPRVHPTATSVLPHLLLRTGSVAGEGAGRPWCVRGTGNRASRTGNTSSRHTMSSWT